MAADRAWLRRRARSLSWLPAIWRANLATSMEYRISFLIQVVGMMLNNAVYFVFWILFFDRFRQVRGWRLHDMLVLFGIVAVGFGTSAYLFGGVRRLAETITGGGLDRHLSLPRSVLLRSLVSVSVASGFGDVIYGVLSFAASRPTGVDEVLRFAVGALAAASVFVGFVVLVQSLSFWLESAGILGTQAVNGMLTFAMYPIGIFEGPARLLLFTALPAGLMGFVPLRFTEAWSWSVLGALALGSLGVLALGAAVFHRGLRRYQSGSAIVLDVAL